MKHFFRIVLVSLMVLVLAGCGVPEDQHNKVKQELETAKADNTKLKAKVSNLETQVTGLKKEIDDLKFGADRLLKDAKTYLQQHNRPLAMAKLEVLLKKHPTSDEAKEGEKLLAKINKEIKDEEARKKREKAQRLAKATRKMKKSYDKIEGITWFEHKTWPGLQTISVYIYFGKGDNLDTPASPRLVINYDAKEWIFVEKYIFVIDGKRFEIKPPYGKIKRETGSYGYVSETVDLSTSDANIKAIVKAMAKSKKCLLRLDGKRVRDKTISSSAKTRIREVLEAHEALGGTF